MEGEDMGTAAKQQKIEESLTSGRETIPAIYSALVARISYLTETEMAILRAARQDREKGVLSDVIWFDHTPEVVAILDRIEALPGVQK